MLLLDSFPGCKMSFVSGFCSSSFSCIHRRFPRSFATDFLPVNKWQVLPNHRKARILTCNNYSSKEFSEYHRIIPKIKSRGLFDMTLLCV